MPEGDTSLYELHDRGLILFSGADAETFLQAQLSCDVGVLANGKSTYGSYCTPQGRILATFLLWRAEAEYCMQLPASLCTAIQKRLSMYILRAKVKATDASARYVRLGLAGSKVARVMKNVFGEAPAAVHDVMHVRDATLIRIGADRFAIIALSESASRLRDALTPYASEADDTTWQWLDIRAGIPWITPPTQQQFVPQMVNLDLIGGVSFSKGCYPGQEIVARAHYRGQVKQRMHLVHIASDAAVEAGDKLYSADMGAQASGMIVNAAAAPEGGYDALAVVQTSSVATGDVHWKALAGPRLAFLPPPYPIG